MKPLITAAVLLLAASAHAQEPTLDELMLQYQGLSLDELMAQYASQSIEEIEAAPSTPESEQAGEQALTDLAGLAFDPDETCALYMCALSGFDAINNSTCQDGWKRMFERIASNFLKPPWDWIPPIEPYIPKCVMPGTDPHAQGMLKSESKIITTSEPSPLGVVIVPGNCPDADTPAGVSDVLGDGDCAATLKTYTTLKFGEPSGHLLHVNEKNGKAYIQDTETMVAIPIDEEADTLPVDHGMAELPTVKPPVIDTIDTKDLPYSGIFYGNPTGGVHTANSRIAVNNSRRFRAERTGQVESVRYHNRFLLQSDIDSRCAAYGRSVGSSGKWCDCKDAGLDPAVCSYTLGSSYQVGNGGLITIEVRPDDGNGLPSSKILAKSSPYVPGNLPLNGYPAVKLTSPAQLIAGEVYHLVYSNSRPPIKCGLSNVSVSKAKSCDRDRGAIGLNGVFYPHTSTTTGRLGPWFGSSSSANLYQSKGGGAWQLYGQNLSWYELGYTDGVNVGDTYHSLNVTKGTMKRDIQGSTRARQRFTVMDATRSVTGVWLNFGHTSTASGAPLSVELRDRSGGVLATGSIASSSECRRKAKGAAWDRHCRDWGYASFGRTTNLEKGNDYSVEFSAPGGAGFSMSTVEPLSRSHPFDDRNNWTQSRGEISNNGGKSWGQWDARMPDERDMTVLFTIEGMPKTMP